MNPDEGQYSDIKEAHTFSIKGKGLKLTTKEDVQEFIEAIRKINPLKRLVISGNTIGVDAALALSNVLQEMSDLIYVDLSDGFTGRLKDEIPQALSHFCEAFKQHKHISFLNLSDNALGPGGAKAISSYLSQATALQHLCIANTGLGWFGGRAIADALSQLAVACSNQKYQNLGLRSALFGRNRLENEGAIALSAAWKAHAATLEALYLPQNGIRADGISAIAQSLLEANRLVSIDLQDNTFVVEGSRAFSQSLLNWPALKFLNLNDAYLTNKGSFYLFKSLSRSVCIESLEYLLLQYNGIRDAELSNLIPMLPKMKNLKSLQLNGNQFSADGLIADQLLATLDRANKMDILDSLSDMESENEEDEFEDNFISEGESLSQDISSASEQEEEEEDDEVNDSLLDAFSSLATSRVSELPPESP